MTRPATAKVVLERHRQALATRLGLVPRAVPVEGGDLADEAVQVSERLYHFASREQLVLRLKEFDDALERVADGTYGACIACGKAIPAIRLKVLPEASRDARCQATFENEQVDRARKERRTMEEDQC